jgi:TPR repeat protein
VGKDDREAVKWWKKSAMQGNEGAQKQLQFFMKLHNLPSI